MSLQTKLNLELTSLEMRNRDLLYAHQPLPLTESSKLELSRSRNHT